MNRSTHQDVQQKGDGEGCVKLQAICGHASRTPLLPVDQDHHVVHLQPLCLHASICIMLSLHGMALCVVQLLMPAPYKPLCLQASSCVMTHQEVA